MSRFPMFNISYHDRTILSYLPCILPGHPALSPFVKIIDFCMEVTYSRVGWDVLINK